MAKIGLTEAEVERIVLAPKSISKDVEWHFNQNESWAKCELNVENDLKVNLKAYINVNMEETSLQSFSLILSNAYCIRRLDVNGSHRNRHSDDNLWQITSHKHKWTDACRDSYAYTPDEVVGKKVDDNFRLFCKECNIQFKGVVKPLPPKQLDFEGVE